MHLYTFQSGTESSGIEIDDPFSRNIIWTLSTSVPREGAASDRLDGSDLKRSGECVSRHPLTPDLPPFPPPNTLPYVYTLLCFQAYET